MSLINIWRIPILFLISGMGVRFSLERRDWKQLLRERIVRILLPLIFGIVFICPISVFFAMKYYRMNPIYFPNPGHLWFLGNIFLYVLLLLPLLIYLTKTPTNFVFVFLTKLFRFRFTLFCVALPFILEAWLVDPDVFSLYYLTPHGFWIGMVSFLTGFILVCLGDVFWQTVVRIRQFSFILAFCLYLERLIIYQLEEAPNELIALESVSWMLAIIGYGARYLNSESSSLVYFRKAVFPIYVIHMPIQFFLSFFLFPVSLPVILKFLILLTATLAASLFFYEYVIRPFRWLHPMFGLKFKRS